MGFYFNDFEIDKKQHINLSMNAWAVIEQDIENFYQNENEKTKSGFLNKIFTNYYEQADASIGIKYHKKIDELNTLFNCETFNLIDKQTKDLIILKLADAYKDKLILKTKEFTKGLGTKIRINVKNVDILRDEIDEDEYYDGVIGQYLKAIFEEYAQLKSYEREQIFFKDKIDSLVDAIQKGSAIKVTINSFPQTTSKGKRQFYLKAYKIVQDSSQNFNYVVGMSQEIFGNNNIGDETIASFRISRIVDVKIVKTKSGFLSVENKNKIDNEIRRKMPQFLYGELLDIKIRFTKTGFLNFQRQIYMRPLYYDKVDGEELTYIFHCTEMQAKNYFIKFLNQIEVLAPTTLRQYFSDSYKNSFLVYNPK